MQTEREAIMIRDGLAVGDRAGEYRRLAWECMALAATGMSAECRQTLVEMARIWRRLADEQQGALPPRAVKASQPIFQR
jgi:hypothetical protein